MRQHSPFVAKYTAPIGTPVPNLCRHLQCLLTLLVGIAFRFEYSYKSTHVFLLFMFVSW